MLSCKGQFLLQKLNSLVKTIYFSNNNILNHINETSYSRILCKGRLSTAQHLRHTIALNTKSRFVFHVVEAHNVLEKSSNYAISPILTLKEDLPISEEQLLEKQWISMSNTELLQNFELLSHYAHKNEKCLSDNSKYCEVLEIMKDRCPKFNDNELHQMLCCLQLWCNEKTNPKFQKFWKIVDNECLKRMQNWTVDEILMTNDYIYRTKLQRPSDFTWLSLRKLSQKLKKMTPANLVQFGFLLKVNRKIPIHFYDYEYEIENCFDQLSADEITIVATAVLLYGKSIVSKPLATKFYDKLISNFDSLDESHISIFLQLLRYYHDETIAKRIENLLQLLIIKVNDCSLPLMGQIADFCGKTLIYNEELLLNIINRSEKEIKNMKLKDICRVLCLLNIYNYDSTEKISYCHAVLKELFDPSREEEISVFQKVFFNSIVQLKNLNFYTEEGFKRVLDPEFIKRLSGNNLHNVDGSYLDLDYYIEIEHPKYNGPRLNKDLKDLLLKKYGAIRKEKVIKSEKVLQMGKLITEVENVCKEVLGDESLVFRDILLPHVPVTNIILCRDKESNQFFSPEEKLIHIPEGIVKYAPDDGKKWYALVIATHKFLTRDRTHRPIGSLTNRIRTLYKIGYTPLVIPFNVWETLSNDQAKQKYIRNVVNIY